MKDTNGNDQLNVEAIMEHWIHSLSGKLPVTMLPIFSKGETFTGERCQVYQPVPLDLAEKICDACNRSDLDIYILVVGDKRGIVPLYRQL